MIEDRDYMRQPEDFHSGWRPSFHWRWSWTVILLAVYVVVFVAEQLVQHFLPHNLVFNSQEFYTMEGLRVIIPAYLPLSVEGLAHGYMWQLLTYQFLHAGWFHLFMNGWVIFLFGRELEHLLGGKRYLALLLSSGIVGGVAQALVAFVWPHYFGGPVVGASAAAFGLVAAYAMMFPDREMQLMFTPFYFRTRTLLIFSAAVALLGFSFPGKIMPGVAHAAHLGGMAMGWFFVRKILQGDWTPLAGPLQPAEWKSPARVRLKKAEEPPPADFMESEVNPILDKISAHGLQSLSKREREILEQARKKMDRA